MCIVSVDTTSQLFSAASYWKATCESRVLMPFAPLDKPLEDLLKRLVDNRRGPWAELDGASELELNELQRQGYLSKYDTHCDNRVIVQLSYRGATYFQERQKAIKVGELVDNRALALLSKVADCSDDGVGYRCPANDQYAIRTLRQFGQAGLVKNVYADNIPYLTSITKVGRRVLAHNGDLNFQQGDSKSMSNSVSINIGGDLNSSLQVQQETIESTQTALTDQSEQDKIIEQIIALKDNAAFNEAFGNHAQEVQNYAEIAKQSDDSTKGKILGMIREIAVKAGVTGITSGALAVFSKLMGIQ